MGTQGGMDPLQKRKGGLLRWGHKRKPPSPKIKARSKAEKLANVDRALAAFKSHRYAICGDSVKILAGDTEEIAGVLWAIAWQSGYLLLLCLLQLTPPSTSPTQSSSATATPALRKRTSTSAAQTPATPASALPDLFCFKAMLLRWMQLHFSSETALQLRVADFSSAWRSAMPIASLLLSFFPSCLKLDKIGLNRMENVSYILLNAARVGCPPILQPAYFDGPMLDEQAILLFLLALLQLTTPTSGSDSSSSSSSSSNLPSISSSS
ncbi:MAG: hypothetical protein Q8P67_04435 [archaeon]|nr:hypothetical protein [archaeon]